MWLRCCAAGITVYSPMRNHGVRPSSRVGVVGIGGLGHMGMQFAKTFGAEVTALSTSKDKEAEALKLGARPLCEYAGYGRAEEDCGVVRLSAVDGERGPGLAGAGEQPAAEGDAVRGGRAAVADCGAGVSADLAGQRAVSGSPTGSPRDLHEMLDVAARHGVKAITERFPMAKANEAIAKVKKSKVRYRAVLAN